MLGLATKSHTTINLLRTKQCVLNLASDEMKDAINALARTTGTPTLATAEPQDGLVYFKKMNGYEYVHDKFKHANLTPLPSEFVRPARIAECPAQMEVELIGVHEMCRDAEHNELLAFEVKILRTYVHDNIKMAGHKNRIDPDLWHPMIMSFSELYGLAPRKIAKSELAEIDEEGYRVLSNPVEDEDAPAE